jgi:hypothetical protein
VFRRSPGCRDSPGASRATGFSSDRLLERLKGKKIFPTNVLASEEPWVARVGLGVEVFESMSDSLLDIQREVSQFGLTRIRGDRRLAV